MHFLHKILVHIPDVISDRENYNQEELIDSIRSHAENVTESFYEEAFDWRETDSAGRWSSEYPVNVLFAEDAPEKFDLELTEVLESQKAETEFCLSQLTNTLGADLGEIVKKLQGQESEEEYSMGNYAYILYCLAAYLYGKYRCDSCFYNTCNYSARLYEADLDKVRAAPQDWALALFDYHY